MDGKTCNDELQRSEYGEGKALTVTCYGDQNEQTMRPGALSNCEERNDMYGCNVDVCGCFACGADVMDGMYECC